MNTVHHPLELEVIEHHHEIEVRLLGHSACAQQVSYELDVTGTSTSRHRGKTSLAADMRVVLSTIRASVGDTWCARLKVEEADGNSYEIARGSTCGAP